MATTVKQRPFCDRRASMSSNYLLQKVKVGKVPPAPYPLPDEDYAYGVCYHDDHGVKEIFDNYRLMSLHPPRSKSKSRSASVMKRNDYTATHKAALNAGMVTPREFNEYFTNHMISKAPDVSVNYVEDQEHQMKVRNMVHGVQYHIEKEMRKCLEYEYGRMAVEKAREKQRKRMEALEDPKNKNNKAYLRRLLTTKASRGHAVKPQLPPTPAETFKMKRFLAIDHYAIEDKW